MNDTLDLSLRFAYLLRGEQIREAKQFRQVREAKAAAKTVPASRSQHKRWALRRRTA